MPKFRVETQEQLRKRFGVYRKVVEKRVELLKDALLEFKQLGEDTVQVIRRLVDTETITSEGTEDALMHVWDRWEALQKKHASKGMKHLFGPPKKRKMTREEKRASDARAFAKVERGEVPK